MIDHDVQLQSQYGSLASMGYILEVSIRVVILLSSLHGSERYGLKMASVNTVDEVDHTWKYVNLIFIEERKRLKSSLMTKETKPNAVPGQLAPMASGHNRIQRKLCVEGLCYNYNKTGDFAPDCKASR